MQVKKEINAHMQNLARLLLSEDEESNELACVMYKGLDDLEKLKFEQALEEEIDAELQTRYLNAVDKSKSIKVGFGWEFLMFKALKFKVNGYSLEISLSDIMCYTYSARLIKVSAKTTQQIFANSLKKHSAVQIFKKKIIEFLNETDL